ncbi:uncharacterized protein KY384_004527 [Bacidia gigantensis]|uniref:uncharacterized protein n=1 Tax=Bacidia gigantensis TaxID=2732470 RepID=UPI001D04C004|nr:uncharacterized protein KY384_004527 [Bacidia gigantensis]KAG8531169.1 hypothetical protein KY384_004527 [Bacidia gigantensis]
MSQHSPPASFRDGLEPSETSTVYLIDTPGFDDTNRSDNEVLSEIASWLTASYTQKIRLSGIIYLHRISDVRMQGSAKKNLFMFKKLCGQNALSNVILATTMWDRVTEAEGKAREMELTSTPDFWGWMVTQGSRVYRHTGDKESAYRLIQTLVQDNTQVILALQKQMADENKSLDETDAGKELHAEIIKERERFEKSLAEVQKQTAEALEARDKASTEALKEVQDDYKDRIKRLERARKNLKTDLEELHERKFQKIEAKLQEARNEHLEQLQQMERERSRKEAELLREKRAAEQRELEVSAALKMLQLKEDSTVGTASQAKRKSTKSSSLRQVLTIHKGGFDANSPPRLDLIMALGEDGSYVSIDDEDVWYKWLLEESHYPGLKRKLETVIDGDEYGRLSHIVLGSNGDYFIKGEDCAYWNLSAKMIEHVGLNENYLTVDVCALGQDGSYIVQFDSGRIKWNLKECYPGLRDWLKKIAVEGPGTNIWMIDISWFWKIVVGRPDIMIPNGRSGKHG